MISDCELTPKVEAIELALKAVIGTVVRERFWVTHYGAYDIHPQNLVYWICVDTDAEKLRLQSDETLMQRLRATLQQHEYPEDGRDSVHIGFESQATVDRRSEGNWWYHWK